MNDQPESSAAARSAGPARSPEAPLGARGGVRGYHTHSFVPHTGTVFDNTRQEFYEGKWPEPDYSAGSLRNWLVRKQRFFLQRLPRSADARVLDLGCGGGWQLFARTGRVVGVDMSHQSLIGARSIYHGAAVGDLAALPFADNSLDLVVSSDVIGHIPIEYKQQAIREVYRVLRPGGRTIHYIEAEGDDPLTRFAKRDPALYQRYIIGPEGHEGIESPEATFARFRKEGFRPVREVAAYRLVMYAGRAVQLYDNEYARRSRLLGLAVGLCKVLTRNRFLEIGANLGIAALLEVTDRVLPPSWGNGVMVEYVK